MKLKQKTRHFSKQFIMSCITEVESGLSRRDVCEKYGMTYGSLGSWLKLYGTKEFLDNGRLKITSHQKRLIVHAIQEGRMTIAEAMLAYKVKARKTIGRWLRESKDINVDIDSKRPTTSISNDRASQDLEHALQRANLKILGLETMIDVAEEQLKINIRKKPGAKR
jgi:transposase